MVNTEKPTGKAEKKKNVAVPQQNKVDKKNVPQALFKEETKKEENKVEEKENKKKVVKKIKKEIAVVNARSVPVSTKYAVAICKFVKNKRIGDAIKDLEEVIVKKKSVPMKGEYAHKPGKGKVASGAGKYPVDASKKFIVLLKSLAGNANANDMDEPYVAEAMANKAQRPMGRFGRWERKRTHIKLVAKEMKIKNKKKLEGKK